MSIWLWIVVLYLLLSLIATVSLVGKEREPMTPGGAAFSAGIALALIVAILVGGGAL